MHNEPLTIDFSLWVNPLKFIAQNPTKRIKQVKNLKEHMLGLCQKFNDPSTHPQDKNKIALIETCFNEFELLNEDQKIKCVFRALDVLGETILNKKNFILAEHSVVDEKMILQDHQKLRQSVQYLKGVGPRLSSLLSKHGVNTIRDLLLFFPRSYQDRTKTTLIKDLVESKPALVVGEVVFSGVAYYKGLRKKIYEVLIQDGSGQLKLKWFQFHFNTFDQKFSKGSKLVVFGTPKLFRNQMEISHPDYEVFTHEIDQRSFDRIVGIYQDVKGVSQKTLRKIISEALIQYASKYACVLPVHICEKEDFLPPWKVIRTLHDPKQMLGENDVMQMQSVFVFEELFFYCLQMLLNKQNSKKEHGPKFLVQGSCFSKMIESLPFELTNAQKRTVEAIKEDVQSGYEMNRLIQGDVGSGKTIVGFLSCMMAIDSGFQAAFLAPTEILASQHHDTFMKFFAKIGVRVQLFVGKQPKSQKDEVLEQLSTGQIDLVIGTHAIIEKNVVFKNLGLVIVDEQHRFGVMQRKNMRSKGLSPHVLVMSATPIPRTLALTMYGDLDVSIMQEKPKGRKPIETILVQDKERANMYAQIEQAISLGQQVFVIYPLIEASEKLDAKDVTTMSQLFQQSIFPHRRIGVLHGRLKSDEKETLMQDFKDQRLDVLISTTVVEVGVDVPNASLMVIEHPERFGLSQLHQLRGRVGRASLQSKCILMLPKGMGRMAFERLRVFAKTNDGFELASYDLKIRGPGDFFGSRQSGFAQFVHAKFPQDLATLETARVYASDLMNQDPTLSSKAFGFLKKILKTHYDDAFKLMKIG